MSGPGVYVGIDVSRDSLCVSFLNEEARTVRPAASYTNDPNGWTALKTAIVAATTLAGYQARVVCGMESTSNMHKGVEHALRAESRRQLEVHVLNPMAVKHFARATLASAKTDRLDSHLISLFLLRLQPTPVAETPEFFEEFREATRTRRRLVEERTREKNRVHKLLRQHFPGSRRVLGANLSARLLIVLARFPSPQQLLDCPVEDIAEIRYGRGRRVGMDFARRLHTVAAQAPRLKLATVTTILIEASASRVLELTEQLARFDSAIAEMLEQLCPNQVLTSIPGVGPISAAAILAEVGDIRRFASKSAFVGYCGLYPTVWESGEAKRRYRMTHKGNRMLKMTLLVASAAARQYNPAISVYYERLRARDKSKKAAGGAIARKLAEIVFTLLARNEEWSKEKATRGLQTAEAMLSHVA